MDPSAINVTGIYFPRDHVAGNCLACGLVKRDYRSPLCRYCLTQLEAILDPSKRHQQIIRHLVMAETNLQRLQIARANAQGDWRRALLSERLRQLGLA